jgi:cytochrome oxidase Cu insertion factor (SCO1/SenC/PrrC family)
MIRRQDVWPLGAIGFILAVTASWWTFALWSAAGAPDWLERTRSVCFNITESGLPDAKGWLLLFGQPPTMFALLLVGWGRSVAESVRHLRSSLAGRVLMGGTLALAVCGFVLAGVRVADARLPEVALAGATDGDQLRLNRPWPEMTELVDQLGGAFSLASLEGRPAMVTFAFGHCETVCPAVVHETRAARLGLDEDVAIVVLTVDPWRDTPSRLESLLGQYELDPSRDHVVSGPVASVLAALDAWDVSTERDERTGDIVHPALVYLVEADGTVVYASGGGLQQSTTLATRLAWRTAAP